VPNLVDAAATGDRRATLEALRDLLAMSMMVGIEPRAGLAKQLRDTLDQLEAIGQPGEIHASDDLATRRAARLGSTGTEDPVST
jgi:hypothetical protein